GAAGEFEHTRQFPAPGAESNQSGEETVVAAAEPQQEEPAAEEPAAPVAEQKPAGPVAEEPAAPVAEQKPAGPVAEESKAASDDEPTQPAEVQADGVKQEPAGAGPAAEETKPVETKPVETKPAAGEEKVEAVAGRVSPKEEMGSQYRERMEDPEDTGEFFLSAFEKPAVKPA
ncbi:MAG TPA: hypothetical protein VGL36_12250, partial [Kribbella sp.]